METTNQTFEKVLKKAQLLGYAEPRNPKLDLNGFEASCNLVKKLGFGGKACIHPDQVQISNKIFK